MPLSTETVPNLPLTGKELAELIIKDLKARLDADGMFTEYVGYGRVSYEVGVTIRTANWHYPVHTSTKRSKAPGTGELEKNPKLSAIEGHPLGDAPGTVELKTSRGRKIESPNRARLENDMPVKVSSYEHGRVMERELRYDRPAEVDPAAVTDRVEMTRDGRTCDPATGVERAENVPE